jgi:hypothetical protein
MNALRNSFYAGLLASLLYAGAAAQSRNQAGAAKSPIKEGESLSLLLSMPLEQQNNPVPQLHLNDLLRNHGAGGSDDAMDGMPSMSGLDPLLSILVTIRKNLLEARRYIRQTSNPEVYNGNGFRVYLHLSPYVKLEDPGQSDFRYQNFGIEVRKSW